MGAHSRVGRRGLSHSKSPQRATLRLELLEKRLVLSADFRSIDGVGNNVDHPTWGAAGIELVRDVPVGYADGMASPAGADRAGARVISNAVLAQGDQDLPSGQYLSAFVFQWGQFLDHDMDLTGSANPSEPMPIPVPADDPHFDPSLIPNIGMTRSHYDPATGTNADNPRQQVNEITSYIDGSNIYGSDDARALALRTGVGGRLKTSDGDLLPFNTLGLDNGNPIHLPDEMLFVAGDIRANETIGLTAMHTLFVREHNYWADRIAAENPDLTDEDIYQRARQIVGAEIQVITYNEFLPAVLGPLALTPYTGYDPTVDASVSNIFSTAAYRVGHTMLPTTLLRLDPDGNPIAGGNVSLRDAFFRPDKVINEGGIDPILRGLAFQTQQEIDAKIVDDVRNFLFDNPAASASFDLGSLNIQRGRDHGLPSYNETRIAFGLAPVSSFAEISSDPAVQSALSSVYASVDDIDVWVGGISEDHLEGTSLGPLFTAIWRDQFERARDGDRYYYENVFTGQQLADLENTTLADIIRRNTGITTLQDNVFVRDLPTPTEKEKFVNNVYHDVMHRPADADGMAYWSHALDEGMTARQIATMILTSEEAWTVQIEDAYSHFLHRDADADGLAFFLTFLESGGSLDTVQASILGSSEYAGGLTDSAFLGSLYQDLLGREIDGAGHAFFVTQLLRGATRADVALAVMGSDEYLGNLIVSHYEHLLERPADEAGLAFFLNALHQGGSDHDVLLALMNSPEYQTKAR